MLQEKGLLEAQPRPPDVLTRGWIVAALLFGLLLLAGVRQGDFWHSDAVVAAAGSLALLVAAMITNPPDRHAMAFVAALLVLALWWGVRAATTESLSAFFLFAASCLACASAYAAIRPLRGRSRQLAGLGIVCLGAAGSLVGFAGLIWRWFPLATPAQGLWRLSTTLTYSDAAGLVLGMCLLVALGVERYPGLLRIVVCLCAGGLLATQSRGAYVAFGCACALVPWRRYVRFAVPLVAGAVLGVAAIATSPGPGGAPWLGLTLVAALAISAVPEATVRAVGLSPGFRMTAACLVLVGLLASVLLVHHEIGLRALAPSDQDRSAEWSVAWNQWGSAPLVGVGPDRLLFFHTVDGTYAKFVHDEYLQVGADTGAIGLALLLAAVVAAFRAVRRSDALASCACAALPFVGFLAGWCAGLAARAEWVGTDHAVSLHGAGVT